MNLRYYPEMLNIVYPAITSFEIDDDDNIITALDENGIEVKDITDMDLVEQHIQVNLDIRALESRVTPRRLRECAIGMQESIDFVNDIDNQIAALRTQL